MRPVPADYRVVAEALRQQIRAGLLAPGERVPGVRTLAATHDTNPETAARALRVLADEGWIHSAPRTAARVAARRPDEPPTLAALAADVADLRSRVGALEEALEEGRDPGGRG